MPLTLDSYPARCGEIVDRCAEIDRRIAGLEAEKAALLGERVQLLLAEVPPGSAGFEQAERSMFAEIAAGLRVSRGTAARALGVGWSLNDRFPAARAALAAGRISARHAAVIVQAAAASLDIADLEAHARYEERVIPFAAAETAPRTEAFARSVAAAVAPETVTERHRRARGDRQVRVTDVDDGMAWLGILLPSVLAHAAHDRLTAMARRIRATGDAAQPGAEPREDRRRRRDLLPPLGTHPQEPTADPRSLDEVRADLAADLLLAADTDLIRENGLEGIRGAVQVTIAGSTVTGADDGPPSSTGTARSMRISPDTSPGPPTCGTGCSSTHAGCSPAPTRTRPPSGCAGSSEHGTGTADSPAAGCPPVRATSTTTTTTPRAAPPTSTTCAASAVATTP